MIRIDATGLSCPRPVILLKNAIDEGQKEIELLVDCGAATENTQRLAKTSGYDIEKISDENGIIKLKLSKI